MSYLIPTEFDVLVIGGGHAGIEAALAATRLGGTVALLTHDLDTVGQMSCNPAIGGLAKGHMVREIDALGGAMGLNTDATAIQFRMLNASKGPSVRAPRAQCDKSAYRARMKWVLETTPGLQLFQGVDTQRALDGKISCIVVVGVFPTGIFGDQQKLVIPIDHLRKSRRKICPLAGKKAIKDLIAQAVDLIMGGRCQQRLFDPHI